VTLPICDEVRLDVPPPALCPQGGGRQVHVVPSRLLLLRTPMHPGISASYAAVMTQVLLHLGMQWAQLCCVVCSNTVSTGVSMVAAAVSW
jgi:hypothetical protein